MYPFFAFKKQTFQFFSVQSLKNNLNQLKNSSDKSKFSNFLKEKPREINQNSFPIVFDQLKTPLKFCIFEKNTKNSFLKNNISFNKEKTPEFSITRLSFPIICVFSNLHHMKQFQKNFFKISKPKNFLHFFHLMFFNTISFLKNKRKKMQLLSKHVKIMKLFSLL